MEFKLIATTGRASGQAVDIRAAKFFIGRHDNCQLRPDIKGMAGIHALIEERASRLYLRDFGAEGGTGLNDRVLHAKEIEIFDGDLIQVGPMVLTLSMKAKGEGPRNALVRAPDGWPFLEGVEDESARTPPMRVPDAPKIPAAVAITEPAMATATAMAPTRLESFIKHHSSVEPDPADLATLAPARSTVAQASGPASAPKTIPTIPIRPHGRRAIDCQMIDGVMVVSLLSPNLQEEETVSPVRYELRGLLEEETVPRRMVIDLGNTRYLSSRAVGVILAHYQGLERVGSTMRVCGVSKEIKPVLDQMRLSMLIDIYPSVEEAVKDPWE